MPSSTGVQPQPEAAQALFWGLDQPVDDDARALAQFLAVAFGPSTAGVLHYGSRAQGRKPRADSAFDFFVIVDSYRDAYRSLAATVGTSYSAWVATTLAHLLPPNVISVTDRSVRDQADAGEGRRAKCCVISVADFRRACSSRRRDHFVQGRLFQLVLIAWARDEDATQMLRGAVAGVRAQTFTWGRPSLPARFTVDGYVHAILSRSLAGEIRPESGDHARTLAEAQQGALRAIYAPLLQQLADDGALEAEADGVTYRLRAAPSSFDRLRVRLYFQFSKVRTTVRLLKHVILYEGWLDYIVRKIERSGDATIVLTQREQRWPLIFLWPRVFSYLRSRPQRRKPNDAD